MRVFLVSRWPEQSGCAKLFVFGRNCFRCPNKIEWSGAGCSLGEVNDIGKALGELGKLRLEIKDFSETNPDATAREAMFKGCAMSFVGMKWRGKRKRG